MNAFERRWRIIYCLDTRREDTIQNLAKEFSVSYDTIQRDIQFLGEYFPLVISRGRGNGIKIMDGFYLSRKYLTPSQCAALKKAMLCVDEEIAVALISILQDFTISVVSKE